MIWQKNLAEAVLYPIYRYLCHAASYVSDFLVGDCNTVLLSGPTCSFGPFANYRAYREAHVISLARSLTAAAADTQTTNRWRLRYIRQCSYTG